MACVLDELDQFSAYIITKILFWDTKKGRDFKP